MRQLQITIYARPNTTDRSYLFNSANDFDPDEVYQFISANLNYSVQSSAVTSTLVLSMNDSLSVNNVLRSGQPIQIIDNGKIVFEGTLLSPDYTLLPMSETSQGGMFLIATIAPSLYQLTLTPMIFDSTQAAQINTLLGINVATILAGATAQQVSTKSLLDYMVTNTDFNQYFSKFIKSVNLPENVFLMATSGQSRDSVLRGSLDFYNVVIFQQEDGNIIIRQLDSTIKAPFSVDLSNASTGIPQSNNIAMLQFNYLENAASTASLVSNYGMLSPDQAISANASSMVLTYRPNPKFYPRIEQLQNTGWFTGQIGSTQINSNITSDPALQAALNGFKSTPDQFMLSSGATGALDQFIASYQALLTGKQMGQLLTGYSQLQGTISLDDPYLPTEGLGNILGTVVDIQNCDMQAGLLATYSRSYSAMGSYLNFNLVPLGSITGYWAN